jgi:hypothetical protein
MEAIDKLGGDLYQVIVVEFQVFLEFIPGADIDCPVGDAEVENAAFVEIVLDAEGLQDEGPLEAGADMKNRIFGQQLHSDKYRLLSLKHHHSYNPSKQF